MGIISKQNKKTKWVDNKVIYRNNSYARVNYTTFTIIQVGTVHGTLLAMEEYIPNYKTGDEGVIVNMSSTAGLDPFPMIPVYSGTKFAVQGLSRSFGTEDHYRRTKVRVLALCPGATDTPLLAGMPNKNLGPAYQKLLDEATPNFLVQT